MIDKMSRREPTALFDKEIQANFRLNHKSAIKAVFELDIDITIPGQGITAIFGESGSGKTTLLRCIAGLEESAAGCLKVHGEVWQDSSVFVPTHKRSVGYVFQEASLFEHLTAMGNLRYAIKRNHSIPVADLLNQVVNVMGIEDILEQFPQQLSGGQRQRVAIARALLSQPKLLLMDEPLASLDTARKLEILPYLEKLRNSFNIPIIYVSHAIDEIIRLADHIVIMQQGKAIAQGGVTELFSRADLPLGVSHEVGSILECKIVQRDIKWNLMKVVFDGGEFWLPNAENDKNNVQRIRVLASDVSLTLTPHTDSSILNVLSGTISELVNDKDPAMTLVRLKLGKNYLLARLTQKSLHNLKLSIGQRVYIQIKSVAIVR